MRNAIVDWQVPRSWAGDPCFILGGGPSLAAVDVSALRGRGRIIAINNAHEIAPFADLCYFADLRWFIEAYPGYGNCRKLESFPGPIVTRAERIEHERLTVLRLRYDGKAAYSRYPTTIAGWCSGANAINIAALAGADPIVLFGFDMHGRNWHPGHPIPPKPGIYEKHFIPSLTRMAAELARDGVTVINATPGSALKCFPIVDPRTVRGAVAT